MSVLCLNYRGLGNPRSIGGLCNDVRAKDPKILILSETKLKKRETDVIRRRLGFKNCFTVDFEGRSGGLMMPWAEELDLKIQSFSKGHIDSIIAEKTPVFQWRFTGFYGHSKVSL